MALIRITKKQNIYFFREKFDIILNEKHIQQILSQQLIHI